MKQKFLFVTVVAVFFVFFGYKKLSKPEWCGDNNLVL